MSLTSMTGFARVDGRSHGRSWIWELKSVNGRGLDLRFRLPGGLDAVESEMRGLAQQQYARGNITLNLQFLDDEAQAPNFRINEALLAQLAALSQEWQARGLAGSSLAELLAVRGVVEPVAARPDSDAQAALERAVIETFRSAVKALCESRAAEGAKIRVVLSDLLDEIGRLVAQAAETQAARPEALRARLQQQMQDLLGAGAPLAPERLAQELAMQITRLDVREELDRLQAHIEAARTLLRDGDRRGIGRKLDFLAQEFNREANTLCSKAFDPTLTRVGLELKLVIDRLREQAQNVE